MRSFFKYQVSTFLLALILSLICIWILLSTKVLSRNQAEFVHISGGSLEKNTHVPNLLENEKLELQFVASLREKNGITLLGSSELSSTSPNLPHKFLGDSANIRVNSFGHAFQQSFAMYCQLLALKKDLKGAKVVILVSPSWFESDGTNIQAFLEFVRPNFLTKIIKDQTIAKDEKNYIVNFLSKNEDLIGNPNASINYFLNLEKYKNIPIINNLVYNRLDEFSTILYKTKIPEGLKQQNVKAVNWKNNKEIAKAKFLTKCTNNPIFVNNTYFDQHIKKADGSFKKLTYNCISPEKSQELADFKLLVKLLKKEGCDASFVIQTLNPYYFDNLESFNPTLQVIKSLLEKENFPYLNQFVTKKEDYQAGILADVMHLGDFGWLEVNQFLYKTYYEK